MREYIATEGLLRSFDRLYDPKNPKLRVLADYPVIDLSLKAEGNRALSSYRREPRNEIEFLATLVSLLRDGHNVYYCLRDVEKSVCHKLIDHLQTQYKLRWAAFKYWTSDDDLLLCQLEDFPEDLHFVSRHYPPAEGEVFLVLTKQPFAVLDIYWRRRCQAAAKKREDPFLADLFGLAPDASAILRCTNVGSFTAMRNPDFLQDGMLRKMLTEAGARGKMKVTFPPGLFG